MLPDTNISSLFTDEDGRIWIGTAAGGLIVISKSKKHIYLNSGNSVLHSDSIINILPGTSGKVVVVYKDGTQSEHVFNCSKQQIDLIPGKNKILYGGAVFVSSVHGNGLLNICDSIGNQFIHYTDYKSDNSACSKTERKSVSSQEQQQINSILCKYLCAKQSKVYFTLFNASR
jgi:hypothetical protein